MKGVRLGDQITIGILDREGEALSSDKPPFGYNRLAAKHGSTYKDYIKGIVVYYNH